MSSSQLIHSLIGDWPARLPGVVRLGMDLVHIPRIEESVREFGQRFLQRQFTDGELAYACEVRELQAERLAARFAAKEATIKALGLHDAGVNWRDMEVVRAPDGSCTLALHGTALEAARAQRIDRVLVSLSHDGDYAAAVVAAVSEP
jgi:holo-[acyl-carrier protein] synthase